MVTAHTSSTTALLTNNIIVFVGTVHLPRSAARMPTILKMGLSIGENFVEQILIIPIRFTTHPLAKSSGTLSI